MFDPFSLSHYNAESEYTCADGSTDNLIHATTAVVLRAKFSQELEALKNELEDSTNTTAAAEVLRTKREQEVVELKRSIDEEARGHEATVQELRRKHTQQLEEAGEQLDQVRKVAAFGLFQLP
jgi:hypothetical protein